MLENWTHDAKCANDPVVQDELKRRIDRFQDPNEAQLQKNKEYCQGCPVNIQCYQEAMLSTDHTVWAKFGEAQGVWGGTTQRDRRKQKRRTAKQILQMQERLAALSQGKNNPIASPKADPDEIQSQAS